MKERKQKRQTYRGWTLYTYDVKLKKGPKVTIYFFSKRNPPPKNAKYAYVPGGYRVAFNRRTELPYFQKYQRRGHHQKETRQ